MIKLILGGVGSGKSVSLARYAAGRDCRVYANFSLRLPNAVRLKVEHIIEKFEVRKRRDGTSIYGMRVNFDFWKEEWEQYGGCDIIIDEAHNIFSSRRAMSKWNILFSEWFTQIRKILGSSERHDLILASQRVMAIDVTGRELSWEIIFCQKVADTGTLVHTPVVENHKKLFRDLPLLTIMQTRFKGEDCLSAFQAWRDGGAATWTERASFVANPILQYFDSYEFISFGNSEYL